MPIDLSGPRLKAAHARHHFAGLVNAIQRFDKSGQITVSASEGLTPMSARVSAQLRTPTPADWSLRIGDVAHNARAALDYLVYLLSPLAPDNPIRKRTMCFPITNDVSEFKEAVRQYALTPKHSQQIEWCQPYRQVDPMHGHALALLAEINNIDKHRLLHALSRETRVERLIFDDGKEKQVIEHGDRLAAKAIGITFVSDGTVLDDPTPILDSTTGIDGTVTIGLQTQLSFAGAMPLRRQCVYRTLRVVLESVDLILGQDF